MSIFFAELRKLLGNKKVILTILAAVLINVTLLVIPEYSDYSPAGYKKLWDRLDEIPSGQRAEFVRSRIVDIGSPEYFSDTAKTEFSDNFYKEQELLKDVLAEIEQANGYPDYLKSVGEAAENMKAMSFFADEDSFNYRNIIKTQNEFSTLSTENIFPERSKGVLLAVKFGASDIITALLILLFTIKLMQSERENGYFPLLRTTEKGRTALGPAKLFALIVSSAAAAAVIYASGILTAASVYGLGDLNRGIQSVYGFFSCGRTVAVSSFLAEFMLVKLLFCLTFSAAVFLCSALPIMNGAGLAVILAFVGAETLIYYTVPATSIFAPLRQINLTALADSSSLVGKYLNINSFGFPVNGACVTMISSAIFAFVCGAVGIRIFSGRLFEARKSAKKGIFKGASVNLAVQELYKCFVGGKALWILAAAAIITIILQKPIKPYYQNTSDYIYYSYVSELRGEYTEEKAEYIRQELKAVFDNYNEQSELKAKALISLEEHAEYLKENGGYFVKDVGYKMLSGDSGVRIYDRLSAAVKAFVLILIVSYSYSAEHRSGAIMLLRSAPKGKTETFLRKTLSAVVCSFLVLTVFDGSRIINVLNAWGTELITAPACSMEHLSGVSLPIVTYLILTEIGRFAGMMVLSVSVFFISHRVKGYSASIIFSSALFVVPPVLSAIGFDFMDYFFVSPFLIGNVIG
ncbi:MAG: hypothetical protein NC203_12410 [Firmicutes bacterium]|nr:hypothetical protein [[Eubacterium] siraeum]MCM1489157.1 hypothetical protein [Bacillota bacterium]